VASVAAALGIPDRAAQVSERGAGWAIDAAFERSELPTPQLPLRSGERAIPIADFATWWAAEDAVWYLNSYITMEAFPGATLQERQGNLLRFQLPPQREPVGVLFSKIESARTRLGIQSYALGQTTLEQIFNFFAQGQEEERGMARGFVPPSGTSSAPTPGGVAVTAAGPRRMLSNGGRASGGAKGANYEPSSPSAAGAAGKPLSPKA